MGQVLDVLPAPVKEACVEARKLADGVAAPDECTDVYTLGSVPVHMLICALDYPGTSAPLTCTQDGNNMQVLAQTCAISDITYMRNNECTREGVLNGLIQTAQKCNPEGGDYFIFFYAGHGANLPDDDGDEADGKDEALCTVTASGDIDFDAFIRDDEFAATVSSNVPIGTKILILCDCCHSGTIGDFGNASWSGHTAVSMSGCKDSQTSGDTGKGGIWTHSCLIAIQALQQDGQAMYSCAQLYNKQLEKDDEVFHSAQDIEMYWTSDLGGPENMAWPFVPPGPYMAPWYTMSPQARALRLEEQTQLEVTDRPQLE